MKSLRTATRVFLVLLWVAGAAMAQEEGIAEVRGTVLGPDGNPQAGVTIQVASENDLTNVIEVASAVDGTFALEIPEPEGFYRLTLTKEGLAKLEASLELVDGEWYDYNVRMGSAEEGKRNQAIDVYNDALKDWEAEDDAAALAKVRQAIEIDPTMPQAHLTLAHMMHNGGDDVAAATAMDQYRALEEGDATAARLAYRVYRGTGQGAKARQALAKVRGTEVAPALAAEIYNRGVAAFQDGDDDTAIVDFRTATDLQADLAPAWAALATAHYNLEQYDLAIGAVDRLLAVEPGNVRGLRVRFLIQDARGDTAAAAEAMAAYRAADPAAAAELLIRRATADYEAGLATQAKNALLQALSIAPDNPEAHYQLGLVFAGDGDFAKAKEHLGRFIELAPDHPDAGAAQEMIDAL
ncbi:MAG: tetratricopeptide repeat protein [Acidobacteriota bacterium]